MIARKQFLSILLLLSTTYSFAQSSFFAVFEDPATNDYYFVQLDATTGVKTNMQVIPGMSAFVAGNKTAFNTDSNYYYVTGLIGITPHIFTIDVVTGTTIYQPAISSNVVGLEYNCNDSSLYGLRVTGNNYDIVSVNYVSGQATAISGPIAIDAYVGGSFSFDRIHSSYNFVAFIGGSYVLQSYKIPTGVNLYGNPFPGSYAGHRFSCVDSSVYCLRENNNQYLLQKINLSTGISSTVNTLAGVTPGIFLESSTVNAAGEYIYRGFDGNNNFALITIDLSNGSVINTVLTNDNAVGFESGICCYDTTGGTVSLDEIYIDNHTKAYPNPASNFLIIDNKSTARSEITITNILGSVLFHVVVQKNSQLSLDIAHLPKGNYTIKTTNSAGVNFQNFVKQ